ncbi:hypothetical protein KI387_032227, partial [Taxus chinensis]
LGGGESDESGGHGGRDVGGGGGSDESGGRGERDVSGGGVGGGRERFRAGGGREAR